jgi:lipid-A-disaccharide synthase
MTNHCNAKTRHSNTLRIFISSGEVSGDMQAAALIQALYRLAGRYRQHLDIYGFGGVQTCAAGCRLLADTSASGAIGLAESLPYIVPAWRHQRRALRAIKAAPPDIAILIDYPGFNIPLAQQLKNLGNIPVIYYIPPEEWVWSSKGNRLLDRSAKLARSTDHILALHPLEAEFYRGLGCNVELVGHPLQDIVAARRLGRVQARKRLGLSGGQPVVALFPASRRQELKLVWPVIAAAAAQLARALPEVMFLLPLAAEFLEMELRNALAQAGLEFAELGERLQLVVDPDQHTTASALVSAAADLAISKSGTVTLELALQDIPQVVVYRLSRSTIWIGRYVLGMSEADVVNMTLVNHIMQQPVVPELLLSQATPQTVFEHARALLAADSAERRRQLEGYARLRHKLGGPGAVERAAAAIWQILLAGQAQPC